MLFLYNITVDINLPLANYSISVGYLHVTFLKSLQETTPSLKLATYTQVTLNPVVPIVGELQQEGGSTARLNGRDVVLHRWQSMNTFVTGHSSKRKADDESSPIVTTTKTKPRKYGKQYLALGFASTD